MTNLEDEKGLLPVGALNRADFLTKRDASAGFASKRGLWKTYKVRTSIWHELGGDLRERKQEEAKKGESPKTVGAPLFLA